MVIIGVPPEIKTDKQRVAVTPAGIEMLVWFLKYHPLHTLYTGGEILSIYVLKVRVFRCLLVALILLLSLPVVHFYAGQIIRPEPVQHLLPRGEALKVYLDTEQSGRLGLPAGKASGRWVQLLEGMREYYRNGF